MLLNLCFSLLFMIMSAANNCQVVSGSDCTNCLQCVSGYQFVTDQSCQPLPQVIASFTPVNVFPPVRTDFCQSSGSSINVPTDSLQCNKLIWASGFVLFWLSHHVFVVVPQ